MTITWEEPKTTGRKYGKRGAWTEEVGQLRANPGRWGVIATYSGDQDKKLAYGLAGHIRAGGYVAFRPQGGFESMVQTEEDGSRKVFARFIGEGDGQPEAEATQEPEATGTVAAEAVPTPAPVATPDSGGEADSGVERGSAANRMASDTERARQRDAEAMAARRAEFEERKQERENRTKVTATDTRPTLPKTVAAPGGTLASDDAMRALHAKLTGKADSGEPEDPKPTPKRRTVTVRAEEPASASEEPAPVSEPTVAAVDDREGDHREGPRGGRVLVPEASGRHPHLRRDALQGHGRGLLVPVPERRAEPGRSLSGLREVRDRFGARQGQAGAAAVLQGPYPDREVHEAVAGPLRRGDLPCEPVDPVDERPPSRRANRTGGGPGQSLTDSDTP